MPANRNQQTKHYRIIVTAGALSARVIPAAPGRTFLQIQNTGANPCLYHFGEKVEAIGGDNVLTAFDKDKYDNPETCPREAVNVLCVLGTTLSVIEGITLEGGGT